MARVTVEDCIEKVDSRFDLVLLAAQRARQLSLGEETKLERDNDKSAIIALREIAASTVDPKDLERAIIQSMQNLGESPSNDIEEDTDEDTLLRALTAKFSAEMDDIEDQEDDLLADDDDDDAFAKAFEELADSLPDDLDDDVNIAFDKD